jgi:hypothetical protein
MCSCVDEYIWKSTVTILRLSNNLIVMNCRMLKDIYGDDFRSNANAMSIVRHSLNRTCHNLTRIFHNLNRIFYNLTRNYVVQVKKIADLGDSLVNIEEFKIFARQHQALLFPAFVLQHKLQKRVISVSFWEKLGNLNHSAIIPCK